VSGRRILIRVQLIGRIRVKGKIRIQIRISIRVKVKSRIRIRIKVMRIAQHWSSLVRYFLYINCNCGPGLYYDYKSGYYYDAEKGLYYDGNSGNYLSFDTESQAWRNIDEGPNLNVVIFTF
jgi:hypothetical protein